MKSFPKPKDNLPARLRDLWIHQLCFLAKRKNVPTNRRQSEAFLGHLVEKYRHQVVSLWNAYNVQRSKAQHLRVTEAQHATSYMMAFHPNNLQRNFQIFKRVSKEGPFFEKLSKLPAVHIVDLGCGGAAWSAALLEILSDAKSTAISVDLMDRSKYLLLAAKDGLEKIYQPKAVKTLQADLRDEKLEFVLKKIISECKRDDRFLFLGLSYVWNEISSLKAKQHLLELLNFALQSAQPVALSFSEPGREQESREAMEVRQWLSQQGLYILYPCPLSTDCPMLKAGNDWCYSEIVDHDLEEWKRISELLKLQRQKLSTSSYVFLNQAALDKLELKPKNLSAKRQPTVVRIVGFPETGHYKNTLLCHDGILSKSKHFSPKDLRCELSRPDSSSSQDKPARNKPTPRKRS